MKDGKRVVITYGTFDLFHKGHYNILKRAREYGDYLIVGVTGESYDMGRGKLSVHDSIAERINNVMNTDLVDEIIIEEYLGQKIRDIIKYNVDVFVIGDDWRGKFDHISNYCELVYLPRTKDISSTQLRKEQDRRYSIGMITDRNDDNQLTYEASMVSGFSLASVFSEDDELAGSVSKRFGIEHVARNVEELVASSDIVFVQTDIRDRYRYIRKALEGGKHVICDIPYSLDPEEHVELIKLARDSRCILFSNMKFYCTQVFVQLLWHIQGGLIGDIIRMECSISKNNIKIVQLFYELTAMALSPVIKLMGRDYNDLSYELTELSERGETEFATITLKYPKGQAIVNVGNKIRVENKIEIIGTEGTIRMGDDWWRGRSFELISVDGSETRKFTTNFSGNGFRLIIRQILDMIRSGKIDYELFGAEDLTVVTDIISSMQRN